MFSLCRDLQVRHVQCTDTMHAYLGFFSFMGYFVLQISSLKKKASQT